MAALTPTELTYIQTYIIQDMSVMSDCESSNAKLEIAISGTDAEKRELLQTELLAHIDRVSTDMADCTTQLARLNTLKGRLQGFYSSTVQD